VEQIGLRIVEPRERPDRPFQQPIGEARVPRQHRAVQVGADDASVHGPVGRVPAIGTPSAQRSRARSGCRDAAMVLEAHEPAGIEGVVVHGQFTDES
jgi:hypothetical protein